MTPLLLYLGAAKEHGLDISYDEARESVYGMGYDDWKARFQKEATAEQQQRFADTKSLHAFVSGHQKS